MSKANMKFPAGSIINFVAGEYSDRRNVALLVTLKECDLAKLAQQFEDSFETNPDTDWIDRAEPSDFPSWLVAQQHCAPVECGNVDLGSYGDWDSDFGVKRKES